MALIDTATYAAYFDGRQFAILSGAMARDIRSRSDRPDLLCFVLLTTNSLGRE